MARTIAGKLRLAEGMRAHLVDMPLEVWRTLDAPPLELVDELVGEFDHLHVFCTSQVAMDRRFPRLRRHLRASGSLWVSWPKGRQLGTDLTLPKVIEIGYRHGLVESTCMSIDATWSALRFTHPEPGKEYRNSYGTLPSHEVPDPPTDLTG